MYTVLKDLVLFCLQLRKVLQKHGRIWVIFFHIFSAHSCQVTLQDSQDSGRHTESSPQMQTRKDGHLFFGFFGGVQAEEEGRKRIVGGRKVGPRVRESGVNL